MIDYWDEFNREYRIETQGLNSYRLAIADTMKHSAYLTIWTIGDEVVLEDDALLLVFDTLRERFPFQIRNIPDEDRNIVLDLLLKAEELGWM